MSFAKRGKWEYAERNVALGAVVIVAITENNELVLVEQFRVPVAANVIELPAGLVGDVAGEPTDDWSLQAKRELLEETGFEAGRIEHLTGGPVSAGFGNESIELFLATKLERKHTGGGVDGEDIVVHLVPLENAQRFFEVQRRSGKLVDPKVYAGMYFAEHR